MSRLIFKFLLFLILPTKCNIDLAMSILSLFFNLTVKCFTKSETNDEKTKPKQLSKYKEERFSNCFRSRSREGSKRRDENMTYKMLTKSAGHLKQC